MSEEARDAWDPALPRVLATFYPTVAEARLVVEDAGLDLSVIEFKDAAVDNWHGILGAALDSGLDSLDLIVNRADRDFPGSFLEELARERNFLAEPPDKGVLTLQATASGDVPLSSTIAPAVDSRLVPASGAAVVSALAAEMGGEWKPSSLTQLADYLLRLPPLNALSVLILTGAGFSLVAHSTLGNTLVAGMAGQVRHVGYMWAVNWSLNLSLVFPFTALFILLTLQAVPTLFRELAVRRMLVTLELRPIDVTVAVEAWNRAFRSRMRVVTLVAGLGLVVSALEWWFQSARPLWLNDPLWTRSAIVAGSIEPDWTIDALLDGAGLVVHGHGLARMANATLSLFAFLNQAVWVAAFVGLLYAMWAIGRTMQALSNDTGEFRLVPNLQSDDDRRGFEVFEPVIDLALWSIAGLYAMFYLSRVWNAYLRSPARTLGEFLADVRVLSFTDDFSTMCVTFGALLAFVSSIVFVAWILREAAKQGHRYLERQLQEAPDAVSNLTGMPLDACRTSMRRMTFWPTNSLRPNALLVMILCGTAGIITAYQFVPLAIFGLVAAKGARRVQRIRRLGESRGTPNAKRHLAEGIVGEVYTAAIALRLVDSREALLAGVKPVVAASLPVARRPTHQLRSDLDALNVLDDQGVALRRWLTSALSLTPRTAEGLHPASHAFRSAMLALGRDA